MEASAGALRIVTPKVEPDTEKIKQRLLKKGVDPTPKIIHTLRKKEIQKATRKANKAAIPDHLTDSEKQAIAEDTHFLTLRKEYKDFNKAVRARRKTGDEEGLMVGKPWEGVERIELREIAGGSDYGGERLKGEPLRELGKILEKRKMEELLWVLVDDVEVEEGWLEEKPKWEANKHPKETEYKEALESYYQKLASYRIKETEFEKLTEAYNLLLNYMSHDISKIYEVERERLALRLKNFEKLLAKIEPLLAYDHLI